jgi:hypothetical protein
MINSISSLQQQKQKHQKEFCNKILLNKIKSLTQKNISYKKFFHLFKNQSS